MKTILRYIAVTAGFCSLIFGLPVLAAEQESDWPMVIAHPEGEIVIYQPQLESFEKNDLSARAAVSFTKKGSSDPAFGAIWIDARVETDRNTRMVRCLETKVKRVKFPDATDEQEKQFAAVVEKEIPSRNLTISLDSLLAMLELVEKEKIAEDELDNTPPKIIFSTTPTVLIAIDGDPILQAVNDRKLMKVVNTPYFIVLDSPSKTYFLKGGTLWYSAKEVEGPWAVTSKVPEDVTALATQDFEGQEISDSEVIPEIIVSTETTELVELDGKPEFGTLRGTELLYVKNTDRDILMEIGSQRIYVLLSGRWFTSKTKDGPWKYISFEKLPVDF